MGFFDRLFGARRPDASVAGGAGDRSLPAPSAPPLPREAVRLRPFVPIPAERGWRSWVGGHPRLPDPFAWPRGDDRPFNFVAQIDCSELPAGLWLGAGPRRGWLAFFVGTRKGYVAVDVLHAATLGPVRPAPGAWTRDDMRLELLDAPDDWRHEPPAWPVEVLVQREGEPEIWRSTFQRGTPEEPNPYADEIVDLARPEYAPHDWPTVRALLSVLRSRAAGHHENALRRVTTEVAAQNAPPPDAAVPAAIRAEVTAAAARFATLDAARPWDGETWVPYAQAAARWRTMELAREMESGVPLPTVAARLHHAATAILRAVPSFGAYAPERPGPRDPDAYRRLHLLQAECLAGSQALRADPRLPPELVGEGGARRSNDDGYRRFRAEQPAVWAEYAAPLRAAFAELASIETALRLAKKPDPFGTAAPTYSHGWPQSHDEAAAVLREWVTAAERAVAWATAPRPDRSARVAAATADLAGVEAVESALDALAARATAGEAAGEALAWAAWRPEVEALLATDALRSSARGALWSWNGLRSTLAARAYAASPAAPALPAAVLAYFLERWRHDARYELACMGGASQGYTDVVEPEDDRTQLLLELPDSRLFGWSWGDVEHLVVAIPLDALRRGDFGRVVAGVTNGGR